MPTVTKKKAGWGCSSTVEHLAWHTRGPGFSLQHYQEREGGRKEKKEKRSYINSLTLNLKELEKEKQIKFKASRRKEIIKVKMEMNKVQNRVTVKKNNETKSCFFEKIIKLMSIMEVQARSSIWRPGWAEVAQKKSLRIGEGNS